MNSVKLFAAAALVLASALQSAADFSAVKLASVGAGAGAASHPADGVNLSVGWDFTVNQDIWVTALGFYDHNPVAPPSLNCCDGLIASHAVRLFNGTGTTLLASTTVSSGSFTPLVDGFRYAPITPLKLSPNETYVIATQIYGGNYDWYRYDVADSALTQASQITLGDSRAALGADTFPLASTSSTHSYFGPNFQFTVPEPPTIVPLLAMLMFVSLWPTRRI